MAFPAANMTTESTDTASLLIVSLLVAWPGPGHVPPRGSVPAAPRPGSPSLPSCGPASPAGVPEVSSDGSSATTSSHLIALLDARTVRWRRAAVHMRQRTWASPADLPTMWQPGAPGQRGTRLYGRGGIA